MAEVHGTPAKNKRGDLPTILLSPEEKGFDPQSLAMTRSIGDLYMQSFGVTWEPEVISTDLHRLAEGPSLAMHVLYHDVLYHYASDDAVHR